LKCLKVDGEEFELNARGSDFSKKS